MADEKELEKKIKEQSLKGSPSDPNYLKSLDAIRNYAKEQGKTMQEVINEEQYKLPKKEKK